MSINVDWTRQARQDLLDIYVLIGIEQPAAAERYFNRIEAKVMLLAEHPRLGMTRPEMRSNFRVLVEEPYLIFYRTEPERDDLPIKLVEIVRVVDGRRHLTSLI
jgi:toxin ParE1/3/4